MEHNKAPTISFEQKTSPISIPRAKDQRSRKSEKNQSHRIGEYIYFTPSIGKGSFSQVFKGHHIDSKNPIEYVAIKRVRLTDMKKMTVTRLQREIDLLKRLDHPGIVKFISAFTDVANNIYIVTEYCNYGSLERFTKNEKLSEEDILFYIKQIRDGLRYLLTNNVLHRDIKPPNILLHKTEEKIQIKIADFGFAKYYENMDEDSMMQTLCGTPMYLAPEMIKSRKYTVLSDLWSMGVVIYQMFFHKTPFVRPRNIIELMKNIDNMSSINFPSVISNNAKELLSGLLSVDPLKRMAWGNFFTHPWFGEENNEQCALSASIMASVPGIPLDPALQSLIEAEEAELKNESNHIPVIEEDDSSGEIETINRGDETVELLKRRMGLSPKVEEQQNSNSPMESFLQQSSRMFIQPRLVDNYIPCSSSVPEDHKTKTYYNSISPLTLPRRASDTNIDNLENFNLGNKINLSAGSNPYGRGISFPPPKICATHSGSRIEQRKSLWNSPVFTFLSNSLSSSLGFVSDSITALGGKSDRK